VLSSIIIITARRVSFRGLRARVSARAGARPSFLTPARAVALLHHLRGRIALAFFPCCHFAAAAAAAVDVVVVVDVVLVVVLVLVLVRVWVSPNPNLSRFTILIPHPPYAPPPVRLCAWKSTLGVRARRANASGRAPPANTDALLLLGGMLFRSSLISAAARLRARRRSGVARLSSLFTLSLHCD